MDYSIVYNTLGLGQRSIWVSETGQHPAHTYFFTLAKKQTSFTEAQHTLATTANHRSAGIRPTQKESRWALCSVAVRNRLKSAQDVVRIETIVEKP